MANFNLKLFRDPIIVTIQIEGATYRRKCDTFIEARRFVRETVTDNITTNIILASRHEIINIKDYVQTISIQYDYDGDTTD